MKKILAKTIILLTLLQFFVIGHAQYATEFYLTDLDNPTLKTEVQKNIGKLLTEINTAQSQNRLPSFAGMRISKDAQNTILMLWDNTPFRCGETEVIERCLKNGKEYQVRNIPLMLTQKNDGTPGQDKYQEAVIGFDPKGIISDFHLAISTNLYTKVLKENLAVSDFRYRQMILDYVEQFRTAYNTKDINFLNQIFSDDALIITGKVIKITPSEMAPLTDKKVVYSKQSKKEYLTKLKSIFNTNKRINVIFDDIQVISHPAKKNFYGVTLKQGYTSDKYSDVGYLFLLWDFTNEDAPKIHVRTWQPEMLDKYTKLPEEEVFRIEDFDVN